MVTKRQISVICSPLIDRAVNILTNLYTVISCIKFSLKLVFLIFLTFWPLPLFEVCQEVSDSDYPPSPKQGGAARAGEPPQPWAATHKGPPPELSGQTGREGASPSHQLGQKCPRWALRSLGNKSQLRTMHGIVLSFCVRDLIIHYQKYLKFFDELRIHVFSSAGSKNAFSMRPRPRAMHI